MSQSPVIVWFRNDRRLADNPALAAAAESGAPVIPVYILDESLPHGPGAAWGWHLHKSLEALGATLKKAGAPLVLRRGPAIDSLPALVREAGARAVYWNRRYDAGGVEIDKALKAALGDAGVAVESFNGSLLREPWEVKTGSGGPYRVFTPFWKALKGVGPARAAPLPAPRQIRGSADGPASDRLDDWALLPVRPDWAREFGEVWRPGEAGAREKLKAFLEGPIHAYADGRDRPDQESTSRLSPHLAHGEISPLQIWAAARAGMEDGSVPGRAGEKFLSEVAWREFAWSLLYFNPTLPDEPLRPEFAAFPWRDDPAGFDAWKTGMTGFPIVDAGMRQLWRTGWMHNRVRMIVASFLIKDLLIPWQEGEKWFRDTLVDLDLANNAASWQWVAGCGADASPYFRIFNPVSQGKKFDPDGNYVRRFVPELAELPADYIHAPWEAPEELLKRCGVRLGGAYPKPIVDHAVARNRALDAYQSIKGQ